MSGLILLLGGCTTNPDRADLVRGWALPPAATAFRPAYGTCHESLPATGSVDDYRPISCAELHISETFHVGTAPDADVPPAPGSAGARAAFAECGRSATAFLGGTWRDARVAVHLIWPTARGWAGGARWFRCDATETDLDGMDTGSRTGTMARALTGTTPLRLGCFNPSVKGETVNTMKPVSCTTKHRAEYVGLWTGPDIPFAEQEKDRTRSADGCRSAIARYTGVPDDSNLPYRSGWISYNPTRAEWLSGERRVRCFLYLAQRPLTRSLRNAGTAALPVN